MEPVHAIAGAKLVERLVEDLYAAAKGGARTALARWRAKSKIKTLYQKIAAIRNVKTIWQVDKAVDLTAFYYPAKIINDDKPRQLDTLADIPCTGNIVLQGIVGQGKSILLRYLCSRELQQGKTIPVFAELRRLEKGVTLVEFLCDQIDALGVAIDSSLFTFLADSGKITIFLDAFDEVDDSIKPSLITQLETLAVKHERLRFIITSRSNSGIEHSNFFTLFRLAPLTEADINPLIEKLMPQSLLTSDVIAAIKKSPAQIGELLTTPLMVTLLVLTYKANHRVPEQLSEFYEGLFELLLSRHDKSKPGFIRRRKCKLNDRQMREVFDALCFLLRKSAVSPASSADAYKAADDAIAIMQCSEDPEKYLNDVKKITCLLLEEGDKVYFLHKSVAEYHAASFVRNRPDSAAAKFYQFVYESPAWRSWRQEIRFLEEIDTYRFCKYYVLPDLEAVFGGPDGAVAADWHARGQTFIMDRIKDMVVVYQKLSDGGCIHHYVRPSFTRGQSVACWYETDILFTLAQMTSACLRRLFGNVSSKADQVQVNENIRSTNNEHRVPMAQLLSKFDDRSMAKLHEKVSPLVHRLHEGYVQRKQYIEKTEASEGVFNGLELLASKTG